MLERENMLKNLVKNLFGSSKEVSKGSEVSNVISLYELQHAEYFKSTSITDESEMFIDLNSVRSVEHNPPNYTLLFNVYLVEYKKKQTIEWVVTADYDYEYSFGSIVKKENLKDCSREQAKPIIVKHKEQESGIKGIARATKYYDFDGNLETDLKAMNVNVKHEGAFEYGDPFYTAAHYAFDRAYHVFF